MCPTAENMTGAAGEHMPCPVCGAMAGHIGDRPSRLQPSRMFHYFQCGACRYSFVGNPRTDYESIYNDAYYRGEGADPLVDYEFEAAHPDLTIREYEWRGLCDIFTQLRGTTGGTWLDYGAGKGGLVAYGRAQGFHISGFDPHGGSSAPLSQSGVGDGNGRLWDYVTLIEVLEHVPDPVALLKDIRSLLKPDGILFLTTGNAEPWRHKILRWGYASCPDIHVGFFEPQTLDVLFSRTGFSSKRIPFSKGHSDIIAYKILKNLRFKRKALWHKLVPWPIVTRQVDKRYGVSAMPIGIAG